MKFLSFLIAIIIICPLIALVITYFVCRKLRLSNAKAFGFAADVVTFLLFFSVPMAVASIWDISIVIPLIIMAIFIAITFTYIDWRTKKEIVVPQLLKKIWRVYFILLSVSYFFIFIAGLTLNVLEYVTM
ncbi:DUF3397 family protein [Metasolibacillus meyeri]|uniref:DUF3397 family protein n=1 Tax=Metasolibacillus meyeri TaxID=1071052 RepID=A0AAW9NXG4_9BACL|nr:DUF3397 family protein [Metasolibacillus meyeri]MEC1179455.1 DUF3397 family protein [Metasolibacillus meyeri]